MPGLRGGNQVRQSSFLFFISVLCLLLFQAWLAKYHASGFNAELPPETVEIMIYTNADSANADSANAGGIALTGKLRWVRTQWLPEMIDVKFYQLSQSRRGAISTGGNTLIDATVQFKSAKDFLDYLPRALQVGLLSPMPEMWRGKGGTPAMTLARKVVGVVTLVFYVCLIGLLAGLFVFRKNPWFWIILVFCLLGILVYTFTYPNIGALMRFRYGFYMVLISFGAAVVVEQALNWSKSRRQIQVEDRVNPL